MAKKMKKYAMAGEVPGPGKGIKKSGTSMMDKAAAAVRSGVKKIAPSAAPVLQSGYNKASSAIKSAAKSMGFKKGGTVGKSKKK